MADEEPQLGADLVGRVIGGRYRIVEMIATGAMAYVYRATQNADPPEVALKVLSPAIARHKTASARFHREAQAVSKLTHPGVVVIHGWGLDGEMPFIAMELLAGEDLFAVLERQGRVPQERAVRIVSAVCDALEVAHQSGVIHRDLKPENIQVLPALADGSEPVKILDFGIAKLLKGGPVGDSWNDETVPQVLTKAGSAVGTPSHMAPEQARGVDVDGRADIYACGVILYEMVTGHLPFEGDNPVQVAVRQVSDPPPPPSGFLPAIHPELETIILRCLEKQPDARFQTAGELAGVLTELLNKLALEDDSTTKDGVASGVTISTLLTVATLRQPRSDDEAVTKRRVAVPVPPARGRRGTELMPDAPAGPIVRHQPLPIADPDSDDDHPTVQESFDQVRLRREIDAAKRRARPLGTPIVEDEFGDETITERKANRRLRPPVDVAEMPPDSEPVPTAVRSSGAGSDAPPPSSGGAVATEILAGPEVGAMVDAAQRSASSRPGAVSPAAGGSEPPPRAEHKLSGARPRPPRRELESLLQKMSSRRPIWPFFVLFLAGMVAGAAVWVVIRGVPSPEEVQGWVDELERIF